ncbi:hypothetical protein BGHDH14_bghG002260000001001 [Blumeria hordei DH14]|uniref:Uncharacterized protein n=1 Tax=Blumeria graminis f. sp. hordei (strain DH14) TaxID=546991 RepID=N1JEA6_BLUG1|nr:hypothetical protein BGHDH14_bghG002260000001001 [Blumeria hordei DH14]
MHSRVLLISLLVATVSGNIIDDLRPIASSGLSAIKNNKDASVDLAVKVNTKRADDEMCNDATKRSDATAADAGGAGGAGGPFGKCVPKMIFAGGLGNRPETEFTFQSSDPICSEGQQEALNPSIIANHMKNVVDTKCDATDEGKSLAAAAVAKVAAIQDKDQSAADAWNEALGLA